MTKIGDICHGSDLGKNGSQAVKKHIFAQCPDCGKTRWLVFRKENSMGISRCKSCCGYATNSAGRLPHGKMEKSPRWKGGRHINRGYIYIRIHKDDPFFPMAIHQKRGGGEMLEHRYVMAQHLGRMLTKQEHIHHKNGDKADNRLMNLELVSPANHSLYDVMCSHCSVRSENRKLKREIKFLKAQITPLI